MYLGSVRFFKHLIYSMLWLLSLSVLALLVFLIRFAASPILQAAGAKQESYKAPAGVYQRDDAPVRVAAPGGADESQLLANLPPASPAATAGRAQPDAYHILNEMELAGWE